jgi:hypothetical protein
MQVSTDGTLPVDRTTAWSHLVRWERQAAWLLDAADVRVIGSAREGIGVRVAVRTRVLTLTTFTEVLEVVRWEPPRLLQVAHRSFVRGVGEWRLDPVGEEQTRFTWSEHVHLPVPVLGETVLRVYSLVLRRLMRRSIERLGREFRAPA